MKISIYYVRWGWFPKSKKQWFFYYKPYTHVRGINIRFFGWHFNIRENNATEKIIQKVRNYKKAL